jgi:hypothetical protein
MKVLAPIDDSEDAIPLGEVATTPRYVDHGSTASTARPAGTRPVIWRGTVEPTNMINGDEWELEGASYQASDADLTTIAALDSATAGAIASDGAGWIKKTYAQFKTALALVKADVGLGNVDNTSDVNKPVSTAQQTALDARLLERGDVSLGPVFLGTDITNTFTSGQLTRIDHYSQTGVLRAREDFTYNGDGTLNTATKVIYADNGTTVVQTVSETYSYTSGELTGVARTLT